MKTLLTLMLAIVFSNSEYEEEIELNDFVGHKIEDVYCIKDKLYIKLDGDMKITMYADSYEITIEQ